MFKKLAKNIRQFGTASSSKEKLKYNLDEFLARHLNFTDDRLMYTPEEILALVERAREVLKAESTLVEVPLPVVIVGDIHGQYSDLHRIFAMVGARNETHPGSLCSRYLFLGDYVDRGVCSLEVICCLLVHKIYYPKMFYLIRGNHEHQSINRVYGFYEEIESRFEQPHADTIYNALNDLFALLPLAALVAGRILCMHGGICSEVKSLEDIRKIKRPLHEPSVHEVACDLLWADPMLDLSGFVPNPMRGISVFFGEDALENMCNQLKVDMVVRGHQVMQNGIGFYCGRKLVTLFSAPRYYPEKNNKAAVLTISKEGRIGTMLLSPTSKLFQGPTKFREMFDRSEPETSYTERTVSAESLTLPETEGLARIPGSIVGNARGSPCKPSPSKPAVIPRVSVKKSMTPKKASNKTLRTSTMPTLNSQEVQEAPTQRSEFSKKQDDETQKDTLVSCRSKE